MAHSSSINPSCAPVFQFNTPLSCPAPSVWPAYLLSALTVPLNYVPLALPSIQVLMYCTAGVRCERASAFMVKRGIQNVCQLEGGIHRYLDAYPEDGGFWVRTVWGWDRG